MLPIVLIHGYSAEGKDRPAADIYGTLPDDLRARFGPDIVVEINLSRWISLSDGIGIDDISLAMERALRSEAHCDLLDTGFHVVIHSTGALVVRNWLRMFEEERKPSPIANLVHLAGANLGSGLAHVGQGELIRWGRQVFQGVESGVRVLDALEFGASKTLDLHLHFLQKGHRLFEDFEVQEFCAIGSVPLKLAWVVPVRYVKEDSSDGVVRTSACNLNLNHIRIEPTPEAEALSPDEVAEEVKKRREDQRVSTAWYRIDRSGMADERRQIPFAVLVNTTHTGGDQAIVTGEKARPAVLKRLEEALTLDHDAEAYRGIVSDWEAVTQKTKAGIAKREGQSAFWSLHRQYEAHAQLVIRIRDQFGADVKVHDIRFKSGGETGDTRLEQMIEDMHINRLSPGTRTYYLRIEHYDKDSKTWIDRMANVAPLQLEISGGEPQSDDIDYLPLNVQFRTTHLQRMIQSYRTTLVDVTLLRLPSDKVFAIETAED